MLCKPADLPPDTRQLLDAERAELVTHTLHFDYNYWTAGTFASLVITTVVLTLVKMISSTLFCPSISSKENPRDMQLWGMLVRSTCKRCTYLF